MTPARFTVGDRVRAVCAMFNVRVGMVGTVLAVAEPTRTLCIVQFDQLLEIELILVRCLELVVAASPGQ
jgi:hypothetical protein